MMSESGDRLASFTDHFARDTGRGGHTARFPSRSQMNDDFDDFIRHPRFHYNHETPQSKLFHISPSKDFLNNPFSHMPSPHDSKHVMPSFMGGYSRGEVEPPAWSGMFDPQFMEFMMQQQQMFHQMQYQQFMDSYKNFQAQQMMIRTCPVHGEGSQYKDSLVHLQAQAHAYAFSCFMYFKKMARQA